MIFKNMIKLIKENEANEDQEFELLQNCVKDDKNVQRKRKISLPTCSIYRRRIKRLKSKDLCNNM